MGDFQKIRGTLSPTVNSKKEYIPTVNSMETVDSSEKATWEQIEQLLADRDITPEGFAKLLADKLDDFESEAYYVLLAKNNSQGRLSQALHLTLEIAKEGKIRTKKAIYFIAILRRWGLRTKFKENHE